MKPTKEIFIRAAKIADRLDCIESDCGCAECEHFTKPWVEYPPEVLDEIPADIEGVLAAGCSMKVLKE